MRFRPVIAIRLTGPSDTTLRDALVDTGADETVFPESLAHFLGVDLLQAEERQLVLGGRPQPIRCRYAAVQLRITDAITDTYEWTAVVGFVAARLSYSLLGHAGFLEYFDAEFRGADRELVLNANRAFPGIRL
jgi:hypothetical protein